MDDRVPLITAEGKWQLAEWLRAWPNGVGHDEIQAAAGFYEAHPEKRPVWLVDLLAVIEHGPGGTPDEMRWEPSDG